MYVKLNMKAIRVTFVAVEKQYVRITYSECVSVTLIIQHAICMRRIILFSVASLLILYFSTFSYKRNEFGERVTEHKVCVFILSINFSGHFSHSKKNSTR
jgi:hypothetical protein